MTANRVLCVEDDEDTREMLKVKLELFDFEAVVAPDADTALNLLGRERFSLYLIDGGMQDAAGQSLCSQIRAADARAPIVIFSGHARVSDIEAGIRAGANAYLVKPDPAALIPTINRLLAATAE